MGHVTFSEQPLSEYTDADLMKRLNEFGSNKPRTNTLRSWVGVLRVFDEVEPPMTVRQMFYQIETRGLVTKTEQGYRQVAYQLLTMRRLGIIPYHFIADNTRWQRKPKTYASLADYLRRMQEDYRRSLWAEQAAYVEIWIEKDALAGVVSEVTRRWDVPLMVTRGFPSDSFVYEAAQNIREMGKTAYLYYFGDFDPSGVCISNNLQQKLYQWVGGNAIFERVAVIAEQVKSLRLPTRPTKRTDTRAKTWQGESVELDAIPPNKLREMVEDCILQHIDTEAVRKIERIEELEKQTLAAAFEGIQISTALAPLQPHNGV